jgi:hypothetical protein
MYFVNEGTEEIQKTAGNKGKRALTPSFSSVGVLMPGRKPAAKGKKRSTRAVPVKAKSAASRD